MACEHRPNRISRLAGQLGAGINQLGGKRAFYAGLGLGSAGLISAGLIALARRRSKQAHMNPQSNGTATTVAMKPIPQLTSRTKVGPAAHLSSSARCTGCQTTGQAKPGSWYTINGRQYCPDCAPTAARRANVELELPNRTGAGQANRSVAVSRNRPSATPSYLPPERRVETRLVPSRLRLNIGQGASGQPHWLVVENGYVLLRANGDDTGLAVTPALKLVDGGPEIEEDTGQWWITHIASGKTLGHRPYASREEAQLLGNVLAQLDWTRAEAEIRPAEISRVEETVRKYNQALDAEKATTPKPAVKDGARSQSLVGATRRPAAGEDLTGRLLADGYGGVARVLDDQGETLFMVDSLGQRYEVRRTEVRTPDATDFEMCRVAMPFDPTKEKEETGCARCGRASRQDQEGQWYRMGWQPFCPECAPKYAAEEGYITADEISRELESLQ